MKLTTKEQQEIIQAINKAEESCGGEILVVLAKSSWDWSRHSLYLSIITSFIVSIAIWRSGFNIAYPHFFLGQLSVILLIESILRLTGLDARISPRSARQYATRIQAQSAFYGYGVNNTRNRAGVLIYLSMQERCCELLVDTGLKGQPATSWQKIVGDITSGIKHGELVPSLKNAIEESGMIIARHYPGYPDDKNELPDLRV